ncbi:uncharacterized protein PRCAT00000084001 [Priceomyces carsonii]|uniref:uncharacterized protein n=1 Tax=Priceomyces carsonii TaxID=28549 RepID=UPI002ED81695|nr:unnamed protein product [Priceomyces carsonii]
MADLTQFFNQCVQIIQNDFDESKNETANKNDSRQEKKIAPLVIRDTFMKECNEFYNAAVDLNSFIEAIKAPYLSLDSSIDLQKSLTVLTLEQKNQIDQEFNFKVQQMFEKLKLLQTYETKRETINSNSNVQKGWFSNVFNDQLTEQELFEAAIGTYRTNILRFLASTIKNVSKSFDTIQRNRLQREKQINLLNFQNFEDDEDIMGDLLNFDNFDDQMDVPLEEELQAQMLTQEQISELETENKDFLKMKTNQLKQVEKLHTSMVDIINLQTELTFQLEAQGDQVSNLLENQSRIEVDVQEGNRSLNKATKRNKKGANFLITIITLLGFLILFVDYISW